MRFIPLICWFLATGLYAGVDSYHGSWAFELPDGNPAWLRIHEADGETKGELLWSVGSAKPVKDLSLSEEGLEFSRRLQWKPYGNAEDVQVIEAPFVGQMKGETLELTVQQYPKDKPKAVTSYVIKGKKMPPMPEAPDLSKVKFGEPIDLLKDGMSGWELSNPDKTNGWRVEDGVLINETPKTDFSAYGDYGNLVTKAKFHDFRLTIEYNVESNCNSGIYLRGTYEAQVVDRDSRMQGISGPGAIFGRIAPSKNAGKAGGEWNRYVLTLVDRHITVELNGEVVTDNQPLIGCTGGGINADDTIAGPILLQGDHTSVKYRNILIEPVVD